MSFLILIEVVNKELNVSFCRLIRVLRPFPLSYIYKKEKKIFLIYKEM